MLPYSRKDLNNEITNWNFESPFYGEDFPQSGYSVNISIVGAYPVL
jgi:hypothetical protein